MTLDFTRSARPSRVTWMISPRHEPRSLNDVEIAPEHLGGSHAVSRFGGGGEKSKSSFVIERDRGIVHLREDFSADVIRMGLRAV